MKNFRLMEWLLLAVVMCVNFTSCSDDDEEEQEKLSILKVLGCAKFKRLH